MKLGTVRMYAPEHWGSLEKFSKFYGELHNFNPLGKRAISGAANHFHKALTLKNLALKIIPNLDNDEAELNERGYTNAINSKELSAVIESIILELYSSIDCTRKVITEMYSGYQGIPSNSTRKFFKKVSEENIDERFPEQLITAVKEAPWYDDFRKLRDELTHLETGSCHKDKEHGKIKYMHSGISVDGKILIIEDIFFKIDQTISEVNQFIGRVFSYLYSQLEDKRVLQFCGISDGRVYTRYVSPHEATDFHSGICDAHKWFELEGNPTCVFASECGVYKNAKKLI